MWDWHDGTADVGLPQVGEGWTSGADQSPDRYLTQAVWPTLTSIDRQNPSRGSNYLWRWDTSPPNPQRDQRGLPTELLPGTWAAHQVDKGKKSHPPPPVLMWRGLKREHFSRGSCSKRGQICKMSPLWDCSGDFAGYSLCFLCLCDTKAASFFVWLHSDYGWIWFISDSFSILIFGWLSTLFIASAQEWRDKWSKPISVFGAVHTKTHPSKGD